MTINDDLATLREMLPSMEGHEDNCPCSVGKAHAALDRVEAEIARLRDGLRRIANIPAGGDDDGIQARAIVRALLAEDGAPPIDAETWGLMQDGAA